MNTDYEINKNTLALIPRGKTQTKVYEEDKEIIIMKTPFQIIEDSCRYFGSSYLGRFEGTKAMVGYNYKAPIIIEESNKIIFFPTSSPRLSDCAWLSLNNIKNYVKTEKKCSIVLKNDKKIKVNISFNTLENQILRATKLWCALEKNCRKFTD